VLATLSWRPVVAWARALTLEGGGNAHHEDNLGQRWRTVDRVQQAQTRDQRFGFDTQGLFVQAVLKPIDSLKIVPAFRADRVGGSLTDQLTGKTSPINDFGLIRQPKLSVVYAPWQQASVYGNWGRSFQVGAGSVAYKIPPRTQDLKPSINDGWELGLKFAPAPGVDGRLAAWSQRASDEVRRKLNDPSGDSENVGKTLREGFDVQLNLRPVQDLRAWLAYSRQRSEITEPDPAAPATRGKQIDHVPQQLLSGGLDYQPLPALRLWASAIAQSSYFLERTNSTGQFGSALVFNLGAAYQLSGSASVDLQVKNLSKRYTEYVWWDGVQSLHSPGDARAFYATLNWRFGQ
jgi:iron complex outermembrane receptor protein